MVTSQPAATRKPLPWRFAKKAGKGGGGPNRSASDWRGRGNPLSVTTTHCSYTSKMSPSKGKRRKSKRMEMPCLLSHFHACRSSLFP